MKPYFDQEGHLTGRAFDGLLHGEPDELARLEIAEHLAFCDHCTERYAAILCEDGLLPAPETLQPSVMRGIRRRARQLFVNRYVAAGVAACLTMLLWLGGAFSMPASTHTPDPFQHLTSFSQQFSDKTKEIGNRMTDGIQQFFQAFTLKGDSGNEKK